MNRQEAEHLQQRIQQEMPVVQVTILAKNHHKSNETYTLKLFHTTQKRILQFNEVESWQSIRGVWML